jgi:hypothetical protein
MWINKLITLGRLEIHIGRQPDWTPAWTVGRITDGIRLRLGRVQVLACWAPKPKSYEQVRDKLFAQAEARDAKAAAEAEARMRVAVARLNTTGRLFRVRPLGSVLRRAADGSRGAAT